MASILLNDTTSLGDYRCPYFIAEVNSSHNGSVETARAMIDAARAAGCSCVKFQSWTDASLYSKSYYAKNTIAQRIVKKFALSESSLKELSRYCASVDIAFSSTPYSPREVDFLLECGAPFVKISSMEINNDAYLRYIAQTGTAIVLSTGMAEMEEVRRAVEVIKGAGNKNLALLHCVSIYPAPPSSIHLNNIPMLRKEFPECAIGFSDHTLGTEISVAATALGAAVIEKHLTLDKSKMGMDNNMAIEPDEMAQLVRHCQTVFDAMGNFTRTVSPAEYEQRKKMRRSVIAARALTAGTVLRREDMDAKRPGDGIPVNQIDRLVGRTLIRDIEADKELRFSDFKE